MAVHDLDEHEVRAIARGVCLRICCLLLVNAEVFGLRHHPSDGHAHDIRRARQAGVERNSRKCILRDVSLRSSEQARAKTYAMR